MFVARLCVFGVCVLLVCGFGSWFAVTVEVNAREVTVSGKRGTLHRSFKHLNLDIQRINNGRAIRVDLWFGTRKQGACIRTVCSHIQNMITGVTKGFKYKMRFCYAHFPINVTLADRTVEVRNYIGDKRVSRRWNFDLCC